MTARPSEGHQRTQLCDHCGSDTANFAEGVDPAERANRVTVIRDSLRERGANARQCLYLRGRGPIKVDLRSCDTIVALDDRRRCIGGRTTRFVSRITHGVHTSDLPFERCC
jgi:hypothetical protein